MLDMRRALAGALVIAVTSGLAGYFVGQAGALPQGAGWPARLAVWVRGAAPEPAAQPAGWQLVDQVRRYLKERYVEPLDDQRLIEGALRGMVEATGDRYSMYYSPQQYTQYRERFNESFGGIGIQVELKDNYVTVVRPIKGTPGERAGLRTGDRIVGVDGKDVTQMSLDEVVALIRGPVGTPVRLTISREPYKTRFDVTITRALIPRPQGAAYMVEPDIGYIRIEEFNENVHKRVEAALADLRRKGMKGLILDLRQNPGGLLEEAVEVASLFVGPGPVVHIVQRDGQRETRSSKGRGFDLPLVVLVDGGSTSAAEIVAGAIQDRKAGVLVGSRTFGKGSVQSFFDLPGGSGLKLTTARYLTASGRSIHQVGIEPDVPVDAPREARVDLDDRSHPQFRKAIEVLRQRMAQR